MGALHEGHAALIRQARERADAVVVTIFLNPLQFGPGEDLAHTRARSTPTSSSAPGRASTWSSRPAPDVVYPRRRPGGAGQRRPARRRAGGPSRPGHFDGVLTVVAKLLHLTRPDLAYFGQKDAQQLLLIRRMVARPGLPGRGGRGADRARARRAGDEQPQHLPDARSTARSALSLSRALRAGEAAVAAEGATAVRRAARDVLVARAAGAASTTWCSCTRTTLARRPGLVPRRGAARGRRPGRHDPADRQRAARARAAARWSARSTAGPPEVPAAAGRRRRRAGRRAPTSSSSAPASPG